MFLFGALLVGAMLIAAEPSEAAGKVVLVTGASSGIGLLSSKYFAEKGLRVVLTARRVSQLEVAVKEIRAAGGDAVSIKLDVTKEEDHIAAFDFAEKTYGGVDYVFANAGYIGDLSKPFETQTAEEIMKPMNVNVQGMALSVKYGVQSLRKNRPPGGAIVVVSSSASIFSPEYWKPGASQIIPYIMTANARDALLHGLKSYEHEGIRSYGLSPFCYETEMTTRDIAAVFGASITNLAAINPVFDNIQTPFSRYPDGTAKLARVVLSMFDGTTKYKSSDIVLADGDATWNVQVGYNEFTSHTNAGKPERSVWLASMKDYKGDPYNLSKLPKMEKEEL